jgi:hypothetical protein
MKLPVLCVSRINDPMVAEIVKQGGSAEIIVLTSSVFWLQS